MPQVATSPEPGPAEDTATTTYDEQVEGLSGLLDDPADKPDPKKGDQDHDEAAEPEPEGEAEAEDAEHDAGDEPDGPQEEPEVKGGRFAPDSAKVRLEDGTVISVADLKRNNLFQRDYTEKTTTLKRASEAFEAERQQVDQFAQSLNQQRDYVLWFAEHYLPTAPDPAQMRTDPMGYLQRKEAWERAHQLVDYFTQSRQAETQQQQAEASRYRTERAKSEWGRLLERAPELKDATKRQSFFQSAVTGMAEHYGFSEPEIKGIEDHRMILVLKDALAYRRLKSKAPQITQPVEKQSAMATGGKRAAPGAKDSRDKQGRLERLRRDGTFESGVASLMDLNL